MVNPRTETLLVIQGGSPRSPRYAQHTRPRLLLPRKIAPAQRDLMSGLTPQPGAQWGWSDTVGFGEEGRGSRSGGWGGIDQATELAAKGNNPAQVPMGPASSSQASPGAIPRPAWPLTGGQPPRQPGDEGSQGGEPPAGGPQRTGSPHSCSTHPFVIDGAVLGQVLVRAASPAQENHQRGSSPSLLPISVRAVL